jgi:hypothetical protein
MSNTHPVPVITRAQFDMMITGFSQDMVALLQRKNTGYTVKDDPLANFRDFDILGILIRLTDKLNRWKGMLERESNGEVVPSADWFELFMDIAGYAYCAYVIVRSSIPGFCLATENPAQTTTPDWYVNETE